MERRCGGGGQNGHSRNATAREDVSFDEIDLPPSRFVIAILDRDRLDYRCPMGLEEVRAPLEVRAEILVPDRLDHLDRNELVVGARQVSVVLAE